MIYGGAARDSAILQMGSWIKSNFCLDMSRSKRRNATSAASRNCALPSTIEWALNRIMRRIRVDSDGHRPPLGDNGGSIAYYLAQSHRVGTRLASTHGVWPEPKSANQRQPPIIAAGWIGLPFTLGTTPLVEASSMEFKEEIRCNFRSPQ